MIVKNLIFQVMSKRECHLEDDPSLLKTMSLVTAPANLFVGTGAIGPIAARAVFSLAINRPVTLISACANRETVVF